MIPNNCEAPSDCIRACVASIIERTDVPNFCSEDGKVYDWAALRGYLKQHGFSIFLVAEPELPFAQYALSNPDEHYILMADFDGIDHAVVCKADKIVHDPAWQYHPLTGPHSIGVYIVGIICRM